MPNLASCATCVFHSGSPYRRKRSKAHTAKQTSPNRLYRRVRATAPAELCYARTASDPDACRRGLSAGTSQPYGRDSSNNGKPISIMQRAARLLESRCWTSGFHYFLSLKAIVSPKRLRTLHFPSFDPPYGVLKHQDPKNALPIMRSNQNLSRNVKNQSGSSGAPVMSLAGPLLKPHLIIPVSELSLATLISCVPPFKRAQSKQGTTS